MRGRCYGHARGDAGYIRKTRHPGGQAIASAGIRAMAF